MKKKFWLCILILVFGVMAPYIVGLVFYPDLTLNYDSYAKVDFLFSLSIVSSFVLACFSYISGLAAKKAQELKYKIIFMSLAAFGGLLAIGLVWLFNFAAAGRYSPT